MGQGGNLSLPLSRDRYPYFDVPNTNNTYICIYVPMKNLEGEIGFGKEDKIM